MNAIEASHIQKTLGAFSIQDLSLTVPSGAICGLVGENGAGKSTTIRLLMGALRPDSGTAAVLGADSSSPAFQAVKEDIGVVLDEAYFPESLSAAQVGKYPLPHLPPLGPASLRRPAGPLLPSPGEGVQGLLPGDAYEAGHRRRYEPLPQAPGAGRGHRRPGPHRPGRGAGPLQRVHPGGGPLHPHLLPHPQRPGEAVPTTSPSSTRGRCCFARRRTPCWSSTVSSRAPKRTWTACCPRPSWTRRPTATAASGRWCAPPWPLPGSSWSGPPSRTSSCFW